VKKNQF